MTKNYFSFFANLKWQRTTLLLIIAISFSLTTLGQSDNCTAPLSLTVNNTCVNTNYTLLSSYGVNGAVATCGTDTVWNRDGFATFTTGPGVTQIDIFGTSSRQLGLALYQGSCGTWGTGFVDCTTPGASNASLIGIAVLPNTQYILRIAQTNNGGGDTTGTICVVDTSPGASNDDCTGATSLTVNTDLNCGVVTAGTTVGATASAQVDDVTGTPNNDVWYSFVATSNTHVISLLNIVNQGGGTSTSTDMGMGVYDATSGCAALTLVDDSDPETFTVTGLTPGNTYVVRVYGWFGSIQNNNFDICVGTEPPCSAPAVASNLTFTGVTANSITGSFTEPTPNADNYLVLMNTTGVAPTAPTDTTNYTIGDTSLGATVVDNDGNNTFTATGLTGSTTYYFYVYSFNNTACTNGPTYSTNSLNGNQDTASPPSNDECAGAIGLTVNADLNCGVVTAGTTVLATASAQADDVTGTPNNDVWFSFTATTTSHVISLLNVVNQGGGTSTSTDMGMGVYDATSGCSSLVFVDDSDPNTLTVTGLTPGNTYVVRVYGWFSSIQNNNFDICVGTEPPCSTPSVPTGLNLVLGTPPSTTINGTFTGSGSDNYLVLISTTNVQPSVTNGTIYNIGDTFGAYTVVDNDTNTAFTATGLTGSTQYYFWIFGFNNTSCSGGPIYSNTSLNGNLTTDVPAYCDPNPSSVDGQGITNVTFSGINNTTGAEAGNYGDYTALTGGTALEGSNLPVDITFSTGFTYVTRIWVDWNDDFDFDDAGEDVYNGVSGGANPSTLNASFTIPGGTAGSHRMRIGGTDFGPTDNPCYTGSFGSFEDYTLVVTPLSCTDDPINVTAITTSTTTATLSWTDPSPAPANGYEYIVSLDNTTSTPGDDITGTTTGNTVNLTGLTSGSVYYVFVRSDCGSGDYGIWITVIFDTCAITSNTPNYCGMVIGEQGTDPFAVSPFNSNPSFVVGCGSASVTLETYAQMNETTSYSVEKIPYQILTTLGGLSNQTINSDDVWSSSSQALPFPFCFFDNEYDYALVGSNGLLTFDINDPGNGLTGSIAPGSFCQWDINNDIPNAALFEQTIFGVYHDIDPFGLPANAISTWSQGTVGCRIFVAEWNDIPMFSDNSRLYSGQIVLYETTNIIEVYIEEKVIDGGAPWNDGNAIVGLQGDLSNNESAVAPCRNGLDTNWEVTNEAWRFTPSGNSTLQSVEWYNGTDTSGAPDHTGLTYNVSASGTYTAISTYNTCSGGTVTLTDDVVVTVGAGKTWNGSVSSDWYTAANWTPNGVPTDTDCVIIPNVSVDPIVIGGPPVPPPPAQALNLTVQSGGFLDLDDQASLRVVDWVNVDSNGLFVMRSGSSLVQDMSATVNTNVGDIKMQRTVSGLNTQDYVYWSTPVESFIVTDISPGTDPSLIWEWTPTVPGNGNGDHGDWQNIAGPMTNGKGYIVRGVSGVTIEAPQIANTVEFVGRPNNGDVNVQILRGSYNGVPYTGNSAFTQAQNTDDNWNLMGNPYPSAISADDFITENANNLGIINGTIHLWTHASALDNNPAYIPFYNDFLYSYNPNDYID